MKNTRLASNLKFIVVDFNYGIPKVALLLALENITELIAYTLGVANCFVYVSVRMTIDPVVDTAAGDEVAKFRGECTVNRASFELVRHQFKRWHMMSGHNDMLGVACCHASFDELAAPIMLLIETLRLEPDCPFRIRWKSVTPRSV